MNRIQVGKGVITLDRQIVSAVCGRLNGLSCGGEWGFVDVFGTHPPAVSSI